MKMVKRDLRTKGARVLALILVVYTLFFLWLGIRRYEACRTQAGDLAIFDCAYYSTLRGELFWLFASNNSYFEAHPEPLLFLFVPIYFLFPSAKTLIFIQAVCIAAAGIPVYLLGKKVLEQETGGILMALAFLFFPTIVSQHVGQVHTPLFALPFLTFAFYFFAEERFVPFLMMIAIASFGKEMSPATVLAFAPYALCKRRGKRWVIGSLVIPAAALYISLGLIRPHLAHGEQYLALSYFPGFGNSLPEVAGNLILKPDLVFERLFTTGNAIYLALLLACVGGFLPFLTVEVLFVLPELFLNLITTADGMRVLRYQYNVNAGAFLVVAALYGIAKMQRFLNKRLDPGQYGVVLAGCVAILSISNWWQWFSPQEFLYDYAHESRHRAFKLIPDDDSLVAGPGQVLAHLTHRKLLADSKMIAANPDQMFLYNWVFFDMNYQTAILGEYVPREQLMAYGTNSNYELVFRENNIFVFHRKEPIPPAQVTPIRYTSDEPLLRKQRP